MNIKNKLFAYKKRYKNTDFVMNFTIQVQNILKCEEILENFLDSENGLDFFHNESIANPNHLPTDSDGRDLQYDHINERDVIFVRNHLLVI